MLRYWGWKGEAGNVGKYLDLKLFTPSSNLGIGEVVGSIPALGKYFFVSCLFYSYAFTC